MSMKERKNMEERGYQLKEKREDEKTENKSKQAHCFMIKSDKICW